MSGEVRIDTLQGISVAGWHSSVDGLLLRLRGRDEDVRLICRCGRSHWIIREQYAKGVASLSVICHSCGTHGVFPMEGVRLPTP